jgi:tRNA A-37 threonylcarbamoyl transferase component Bud32
MESILGSEEPEKFLEQLKLKLPELVNAMHDCNIVHLDISTGNVLARRITESAAITDFALTLVITPNLDTRTAFNMETYQHEDLQGVENVLSKLYAYAQLKRKLVIQCYLSFLSFVAFFFFCDFTQNNYNSRNR